MRALVAELPPINRQLLGRLAAHFAKVVKRSRLNRMSWAAVAVAVAPTLLRGGEGGPAAASPDALARLAADARAGQESEIPNFKGSYLGRFPLVRLMFGRASISRNGLEAWMLFPERARVEHSR